MAIFGIGAYYEEDVSSQFIEQGIIGVGWDNEDAPELQEYFRSFKTGDIVYIKAAFGGNDITVKAIGIISNNVIITRTDNELVSTGRNVRWLHTERFVIPRPREKNNVRSNTVYEEFHPVVQQEILMRIIPTQR
ncbi:MAG: hypothetical protein SFY32_11290 [Bacteroidota bacterium]|nr:hypothetical protein [Bacteroidota bacterium]